MSYIQNVISIDEEKYNIIPSSWMPTKFYNITFEGWKGFSLDANCSVLTEMVTMASITIKGFIELYKDTHAFSQPGMYIKPDGTFGFKIMTMEIELYEERMKNE